MSDRILKWDEIIIKDSTVCDFKDLGPVVRTPLSANPGFSIFLSKALSRIIFSILFRVSNHHCLVGKEN